MKREQLEELGESLRRLGHERREVVEKIIAQTENGRDGVGPLYRELDQISERAIGLMEKQRDMIRDQLT